MNHSPISLPPELLGSVFPFHIVIDRKLQIIQCGDALRRRYLMGSEASDFHTFFRLLMPICPLSLDALREHKRSLFVLEAMPDKLRLQGDAIYLEAQDALLLLVSPALSGMDDMDSFQLSLNDFPLHDRTLDYLFALQTQQVAIQDAHNLNERLEQVRERLEAAYQKAQDSENRYRSVVESIKEVIFQTDAEGAWLYLNPSWTEITGFSVEETLGNKFLSYVHPDDRQRNYQLFLPLLQRKKEYCRHEVRYLTKDGGFRWVEVYARLTLSENDEILGTSGTLVDVTEHRLAETALRESEDRLRSIFDHAVDGIIVIDSYGAIESFNPAAEAIFGYSTAEILGQNVSILMPSPYREKHDSYLIRYAETGERHILGIGREVIATRKDGSLFAAELSVSEMRLGSEIKFTGIVRDITERKANESAQRRIELRRSAILNAALDAIISIDHDGYIIEFNPAASRIFGYAPSEAIGRLMSELIIPPAYRDAHYTGFRRYLSTGEPRLLGRRIEIIAARKDGTEFPIELAITVVREYGPPIFTAYLQDISERKRTEMELAQARAQEVEIGARIQQTLLMSQPPQDIYGAELGVLSQPSQRIDGDYVDFFRYDAHTLDILVGDVMGKGVPAALLGAATKTYFQRAVHRLSLSLRTENRLPRPEEIVERVHRRVTPELMQFDSFITLCYARLDLRHRIIQLVDCGHPRGLHWHQQTQTITLLEGGNLPLGYLASEIYEQFEYSFELGDVFLFYSDGIPEATSVQGQAFGRERLQMLLRQCHALPAQEIIAMVQKSVVNFADPNRPLDDLTCVTIKILPSGGRETLEMRSSLAELETARDFVRRFCAECAPPHLDEERLIRLTLAVNEAVTNITIHAYGGQENLPIHIIAEDYEDKLQIHLLDWGGTFSPEGVPPPSFDGSRDSGFGLFLIEECVDKVERERSSEGRNHLILTMRKAGDTLWEI